MRVSSWLRLSTFLGFFVLFLLAVEQDVSAASFSVVENATSIVAGKMENTPKPILQKKLHGLALQGPRNNTANKGRPRAERRKNRKQKGSTKPVSNVVFVKCFKVAGGTLRRILEKQAKIRNLTIVPSPEDKTFSIPRQYGMNLTGTYNMITKHAKFHPWMKKVVPDAVFITMIRDPFRRASSHYNHFNPMAKNKTFERFYMENFLKSNSSFIEQRGYMGYKDNHIASYLGYSQQKNITFKSLEKRYNFIGFQERFNESMVLLGHVLNWDLKTMEYFYRHYNPHHLPSEPSEEFLRIFKRKNYLDYRIYELGLKHYERNMKKYPNLAQETQDYVSRLDKRARHVRVLKKARGKLPENKQI